MMKMLKLLLVCAVSLALGMIYSGCERHEFEHGTDVLFEDHHGEEGGGEKHGKAGEGKGEHKGGAAGKHGADEKKGAEGGRKVF